MADDDLGTLVLELKRTLQELETTLEPRTSGGMPRPPTPAEFARFASEVAIPAALLVLRVNVETLRLLQRTLRMADGRAQHGGAVPPELGDRARRASRTALDQLEGALVDLQEAIQGEPPDDETRELLARARELRGEVDDRLRASEPGVRTDEAAERADVPVDVEAELRSIRRTIDEERNSDGPASPSDGDSTAAPGDDDPDHDDSS